MPPPTTQAQKRGREIVADPLLRELPYNVETNAQGQIILSPNENSLSFRQKIIQDGQIRFFAGEERERSSVAPDCPNHI